jgi:chloramphenicol 3-O-phosphotransferase
MTVYLLTGPSASGKTTVAALLARRFPRGVHVEGDVFRRFVVSGRQEMTPDATPEALDQLRLRYSLAAAAADAYANEGFTVVLEDVIAGAFLSECTELVRTRPLHVVVLLPSVEALAARDSARTGSGYDRWQIQELHAAFSDGTPRVGVWLDSSEQTPEQTVDEILARTRDESNG